MKLLRDVVPQEFFNECRERWSQAKYAMVLTPAAKLLDVPVVKEYSRVREEDGWKEFPGPQMNVHCWWELENGKAVGWNENPATGWSFPVVSMKR